MKRLTVRSTGIHVNYRTKYNGSILCSEMSVPQRKECMEKLAQYEDAGLEPQEVEQYKIFEDGLVLKYGCTLQQALDLLELYKQGLLIKLSCKEQDIIYVLEPNGNIQECKVYNITTNIYANSNKNNPYWKGFEVKDNLFGKTVFLTKEEALKGAEHESQDYFFKKDMPALNAFKMAIQALEKQAPKKPRDGSRAIIAGIDGANCSVCSALIFSGQNYCSKCGQKLDWSEVE